MAKRVDQLFQSLNYNAPYFRTPTPASAGPPHVIIVKKPLISVKTLAVPKEPHVKTKPKIVRKMKSAATKAISATKGIYAQKSTPGFKAKEVTKKTSVTKKKSANKVKSNPKFKSPKPTPITPNLLPGLMKPMSPYITHSAAKVKSTTKSATKVKSISRMNSAPKKKSVKRTKLITKVRSVTKAVTITQPQYVNMPKSQTITKPMADMTSQSKATTVSFTKPIADRKFQSKNTVASFINSTPATKPQIKSTLVGAKQPVTNMGVSVYKRQSVSTPQNVTNLKSAPTIKGSPIAQTLAESNTLVKQQTTNKSSTSTTKPASISPKPQDFTKLRPANKLQPSSQFSSAIKPKVNAKSPPVMSNPQAASISQTFYKALLHMEPPCPYQRSALSKSLSRYALPTLTQPQTIANALNITRMLTSTTPSIVVKPMNVTVPQNENTSQIKSLEKLLPSKNFRRSDVKMTQIFPAVKQAHTDTNLVTTPNSRRKYTNQFDTKLKLGTMQSATKPQTIFNEKASSRPQTRNRTQTPIERLQTSPTLDTGTTKPLVQTSTKLQTHTNSNIKPLAVELSTADKMAATTALLGTKSLASWQIDSKANQRNNSVHRTVIKTKTKMSCSSPHLRNQTTTNLQRELPIPVCTPSVLRPSKADIHGRNTKTKIVQQIKNPTYEKMCNTFDAPEKRILIRAVKLLESQTRPTPMAAKSLSGLKATGEDSRISARLKPAARLTTFSGLKIRK